MDHLSRSRRRRSRSAARRSADHLRRRADAMKPSAATACWRRSSSSYVSALPGIPGLWSSFGAFRAPLLVNHAHPGPTLSSSRELLFVLAFVLRPVPSPSQLFTSAWARAITFAMLAVLQAGLKAELRLMNDIVTSADPCT